MSAHRTDITTSSRIHIGASLHTQPPASPTRLAQEFDLSRQSVYDIKAKTTKALQAAHAPQQSPPNPHPYGFWIWIDLSFLQRLIVTLRAYGLTISAIAHVVREATSIHISSGTIHSVCLEAYQRAFDYRESVDLSNVSRASFDEMIRHKRNTFTGVDVDTHFIFLAEKQPNRSSKQWKHVLRRLRDNQGLNPEQISFDGGAGLQKSVPVVFPEARLVDDLNHLRRAIDRVHRMFENRAYKKMEAAFTMEKRVKNGPTHKTSQQQLDEMWKKAQTEEQQAIELVEQVGENLERVQHVLNVIHPKTGHVNDESTGQQVLCEVAESLKDIKGALVKELRGNLKEGGVAHRILRQRTKFRQEMIVLAAEHQVSFEVVEQAVWLWELNKQTQKARWAGTKEQAEKKMFEIWSGLKETVQEKAFSVAEGVIHSFGRILATSSAVEGCHPRIGSVAVAQKRWSSGWLNLRVGFLNLNPFVEGKRAKLNASPHELLTGERVKDWLEHLGYGAGRTVVRQFKKLGWPRLAKPVERSWRNNWGLGSGVEQAELEEALAA